VTIKNDFFEKGYLTNIGILKKTEAISIANEYHDFLKKKLSNTEFVEHKSKTHLYFEWANKIIKNEKILSTIKDILGNNIYCWNSLIFYKPPKSKKFVSMHQDQNYWGIIHDKALTVSLALTESKIENGCLKLLPFSHKKEFKHEDFQTKNNMLARGQSVNLNQENENNLKNIELEPGECCIFHGNIVHGSGTNESLKPRMLYAMRFLTTDNKVNTKLYYNNASLVSGEDKFNFFEPEPSLQDVKNIQELRILHKKIIIKQFSRYLLLKIKSKLIVVILMKFFRFNFLRGFVYSFIK
jgi:ectoine hydroxylase-related dioxygenase (phytanoyl-CoA dioxygenase family)